MASSYAPYLKPKENSILIQKITASDKTYTPKSKFYSSKFPNTLTLPQRINTERKNLTKLAKTIHNRVQTLTEESETLYMQNSKKSKSNHFLIKSKTRTNEGLMGNSVLEKVEKVEKIWSPQTIRNGNDSQKINTVYSQNGNQKQCWENSSCEGFDWTSFREEQLMSVLNSESLKQKNLTLEGLFEENPDYFGHLFGMCACYRCACGRCKCKYAIENNLTCKFNLKNKNSTYALDFAAKSPDHFIPKTEKIKGFEESIVKNPPMDSVTINQTEYRPFAQNIMIRQKGDPSKIKESPFLALTHYKSEYADWQNYDRLTMKRPFQQTVIKDLPFVANTTYNDTFSSISTRKNDKVLPITPKNGDPFFKCVPFLGESTAKASFQNYSNPNTKFINTITNFKATYSGSSLEKSNCQTSPRHFESTMTKDFKGMDPRICPAQVNMNHKEDFKLKLFDQMKEWNQKFIEKN